MRNFRPYEKGEEKLMNAKMILRVAPTHGQGLMQISKEKPEIQRLSRTKDESCNEM